MGWLCCRVSQLHDALHGAQTSWDVPWAGGCSWPPAVCSIWGSASSQRMLCLTNRLKILLSPRLGMVGRRKWLLLLVQGWRSLLGASLAEEVAEMKMPSRKPSELFVSLLAWLSGTASHGCVRGSGASSVCRSVEGIWGGVAPRFPMQCGSSSPPRFVFIEVKLQKLWSQPLPLVGQTSAALPWLVAAQLGGSSWCCLHPLAFPCPHPCCCCPGARQGWEQAQHQEVYPGRRK